MKTKTEEIIKLGVSSVTVLEKKKVDRYGNVVYWIYWFDKEGNDITRKMKFWSFGSKPYDRTNRYLTDKWLKDLACNNNLVIRRIKE